MKFWGKGCISSGQLDWVILGNALSYAKNITSTHHAERPLTFKRLSKTFTKGFLERKKDQKNHPTRFSTSFCESELNPKVFYLFSKLLWG